MIIYTTELYLYHDPIEQVLQGVQTWLRSKYFYGPLDLDFLLESRGLTRYNSQYLEIFVEYDYNRYTAWGMRFTHGDKQVQGRRWHTELGLKLEKNYWHCTILVQTSEVNLQVAALELASRPRLVNDLLEHTRPHESTPGLEIYILNEDYLLAVRNIIEDRSRSCPIVIISPLDDGSYVVPPELVRSHVVTLAQVYVIPPDLPFEERDRVLGPRYNAWDGAVKVLWPYSQKAEPWERARVNWFNAEELLVIPSVIERVLHILTRLTDRRNFSLSNRHLSIERLREQHLHQQLKSLPLDQKAMELLLEEAEQSIGRHNREKKELEVRVQGYCDMIDDQKEQIHELLQENAILKTQLTSVSISRSASVFPAELHNALYTLVANPERLTLSDALKLIEHLFPERVVILDSARRSARDAAKFQQTKTAWLLLWKLVTDYWELLCNGGHDGEALNIFGKDNFAAKESTSTQQNTHARRLRTFEYKGQQIEMFAHLRIGYKHSIAQTWRAHFYWDADERRIVLGHCGKHLDFG